MRTRLIALLLAMLLAPPCGAAAPQRIVSLNLCTDQLALALVPAERIAMLSQLAADPGMSWLAERARPLRRFDGSTEDIVALDPDLILVGTLALTGPAAVLRRLGYRVETLEMPESIDGSLRFIERTAALLGEEAGGRRLATATRERLAAVRSAAEADARHPLALVYMPNGLALGAGTLKHELLELAGFADLAARRGITGYGSLPLESLVVAAPDLVIVDAADLEHVSMAQQLLRHPAMRARIPLHAMPTGLWICGGPQIAQAAERLQDLRSRAETAD